MQGRLISGSGSYGEEKEACENGVGDDDPEDRVNNGRGGGTSNSLGPSLNIESLKAGNGDENVCEDCGFNNSGVEVP